MGRTEGQCDYYMPPKVPFRGITTAFMSIIIGGTQIITNTRKTHLLYKIIHFSVQFTAIVNIFIVKA